MCLLFDIHLGSLGSLFIHSTKSVWNARPEYLPTMLTGTLVTLKIFFLTLLLSIPLAIPIALGRMSRIKPLAWLINVYLLIMRGTPLILQIIFIYFAPYFLFKRDLPDRFFAVIVAFTINYAAYFAEIFRGGIASIPVGQYEAAKVLGFTKIQTFFRIVLPQATKRVIPATANEVVTLVKDTALAQTIGVAELFRDAQTIASSRFSVMPLFVAGLFYLILNAVADACFQRIEKKLDYYR